MEQRKTLQIKVLGPGCVKCRAVEQMAAAALLEVMDNIPKIRAELVHIEDPHQIQEYSILGTPGLVINEKVVCAGRTPSKKEIIEWLRDAIE